MNPRIILIILLFQANISLGQTSLKDIGLINGDYKVGFKHYVAYDNTRTYKRIFDWNNRHIPRPIPISMWYPSNSKSKGINSLSILNYMEILKEEEEWEYLPNAQILNWFYYINTPENQRHLNEKTSSYFKIEPADGKVIKL